MNANDTVYWVNPTRGEWGVLETKSDASKKTEPAKENRSVGIQKWVDHFIHAYNQNDAVCFVEDKAEFNYIYRCFEMLSRPLSFSPVCPAGMGTESRVAA